ncbi:DNA topoisomerase I [Crepidotus variabilis]|uniref:DNA topoisomerase I n=1 Tax=Crepidotus variabilis TaxID=179855 RepID=A0A9P6EI56_9AGAR|nr:DNA topoisomerase I [Crepidotus variabilis]
MSTSVAFVSRSDNEQGMPNSKWLTLEHNGVLFPPPYEPLPDDVKMKYDGKAVDLPPEAEEVAGFYAAILELVLARDNTFKENFFQDWLTLMKRYPPRDGTIITSFDLCDFRPMFEHFEAEKAKKLMVTSDEKKGAKTAKDRMEAKYIACSVDGSKGEVGNFRIEPPGLFRGRSDHPKKGSLKFRIGPEDITLNIGEGAPIPIPNIPGNWKAVTHDHTVTWIAQWTENVNGYNKYAFLTNSG